MSARLLPRLLAVLRQRHPGIEVVLFEGSDEEVREWLRSDAIDVGVVTLPRSGFHTTELGADDMVAVVSDGHRLTDEPRLRLRDLQSDAFIMSTGGCEPLIRRMFRSAAVPLRVRYHVRDMATILAMVREGLGVTVVPALALPEGHPGIRALPVSPPTERRLALAVRRREAPSLAAAVLIQEASMVFRR